MSKENDEKVVQEIIEYANNEIKKSKKKHLVILLSILISIVILSAVLVLVFTVEGGQVMCLPFGIVAVVAGILNVIWTLLVLHINFHRRLQQQKKSKIRYMKHLVSR